MLKNKKIKDFYRPTFVEIAISSFIHNLKVIRKKISVKIKLLAVVKANAYGHGAVCLSKAAVSAGADYLGVSSIEEGILLRKNRIRSKIIVLGSHYPFSSFNAAVKYNLIPTVASQESAGALSAVGKKWRKNIPYHFKVDTGMGRIGATPLRSIEILKKITQYKNIHLEGIYTHLASADTDGLYTLNQLNLFDEFRACLDSKRIPVSLYHAANSAATAQYRNSYGDMVRIGLALYGLRPLKIKKYFNGLKPVLSWKTKIIFLKWLSQNKSVSYGNTYITKRKTHVATLPVGYADGYNRLWSNNAFVLIHGKRCPVIGSVTMDMIMIDVTRLKNVKIGDFVVLIGTQGNETITAEEMAQKIGSISYEVVCGINARVPRIVKQ